jgi:hypothetical protein
MRSSHKSSDRNTGLHNAPLLCRLYMADGRKSKSGIWARAMRAAT